MQRTFAELKEAGFVAEDCTINPETGDEMREKRYRLKDNYARFYLRYVEPHKKVIDEGAFSFTSLDELDGIESVLGLAFENLVVNNYRELLSPVGLGAAQVLSAAPYRRTGGKKPGDGVQVDLLLQMG